MENFAVLYGFAIGVVLLIGVMTWVFDKRSSASYGITGTLLGFLAVPLANHRHFGSWMFVIEVFLIVMAFAFYVMGLWINRNPDRPSRREPYYTALASGVIALIMPMLGLIPGMIWLIIGLVATAVIGTVIVMRRMDARPDYQPHRTYPRGDRLPSYGHDDFVGADDTPTQQLDITRTGGRGY